MEKDIVNILKNARKWQHQLYKKMEKPIKVSNFLYFKESCRA